MDELSPNEIFGPGATPESSRLDAKFELIPVREIVLPQIWSTIKSTFLAIPIATVIMLLAWFFVGILFGVNFRPVAVLRTVYIGLMCLESGLVLLVHLRIFWWAHQRRVPYRLLYEAMVTFKLHSEYKDEFKTWSRAELETKVELRRTSRLLAKTIVKSLFGRRS